MDIDDKPINILIKANHFLLNRSGRLMTADYR